MNTRLIFQTVAVFGAIAVAVAIFGLRSSFSQPRTAQPLPPGTNADAIMAATEETLTKVREQFAKLQADNEKLLAKLQTVTASNKAMAEAIAQKVPTKSKSASNPFAAMFGGGDDSETNGMAGAMQQLIKSQMEQQTEGKINRMKTRLHLTPEQEKQIRDVMTQSNEKTMAITQKIYSGEAKPEELKEVVSGGNASPKGIEEVLDPAQLTEYKAMEKEEQQNNARLLANAEMLQLQNSLGLSQEQQDKVFGVLYQLSLDSGNPTAAGVAAASAADPAAAMQQAFEKKLEALTPVLTADQLKSYRDLQEQQMKLIQAFMPKVSQPDPPTAVVVPKP